MVFNRFRIYIILRVISLVLVLSGTIYFFRSGRLFLALFFAGLSLYLVFELIRYVEKINRDLNRFLESIEYSDFSQSFSSAELGPTFKNLKQSFNRVTTQFLKVRTEKEERFRYFQTVVEHVGSGLISFKSDGDIEFMNNTARRLLRVGPIHNISALERISKNLCQTLLKLKSGEKTLIKLGANNNISYLSVHATQFKLHQQKFTLVTLQDIHGELERERLGRELEIGHEVQQKLLPDLNFNIPGYQLAGQCLPAKEVGGDYYDIIRLDDDNLAFVIGDVSGKGLPAAIYMTLTKGILQSCASIDLSPAHTLCKANRLVYQSIESDVFVSLFYARLNQRTNEFFYARAGHNPLIYFNKKTGKVSFLKPDGIALGLESGAVFEKNIAEESLKLESGDIILFYTDGFTEAMDKVQEEFGEERLAEIIQKNCNLNSDDLMSEIRRSIDSHIGETPAHDDMTMVILKAV